MNILLQDMLAALSIEPLKKQQSVYYLSEKQYNKYELK